MKFLERIGNLFRRPPEPTLLTCEQCGSVVHVGWFDRMETRGAFGVCSSVRAEERAQERRAQKGQGRA